MSAIAIPQREILIPRFEFPVWAKKIGDPMKMFRGAMSDGGVFAQAMGGAGGFTPLSLPLVMWLKADAGTGGVNDGDAVTTWTDQSGNGNSPTQGTPTKRPLYKKNIKNGLPAVLGDGTDDFLQTAAFGVEVAQPYTVFFVFKLNVVSRRLLDGIADPKRFFMAVAAGPKYDFYFGGADVLPTTPIPDTNWHILRVVASGNTSVWQVDGGTENALGGAPGTANLGGLVLFAGIGGALASSLYIGEFILARTDLAAGDDAATMAYLNARWAVY